MSGVRVTAAADPGLNWGAGGEAMGAYAAALAALPDGERLGNGRFEIAALQLAERAFPVIAPTGAAPQAWPLSLATVYGRVAREEVRRALRGAEGAAFEAATHAVQGVLGATGADRLVFVNHPLLSTSLWGGWDGAELRVALEALTAAYPDRAIAFRALNDWSDAGLLERLAAAGAKLIPSRVVWVVDDVARDWLAKRDAKRDFREIGRAGYRIEPAATPDDAALERVRGLYRALYLDRHSRFNPDYRPGLLRAGLQSGLLRFQLLRRIEDGRIDGFVACYRHGEILTSPLLGYDLEVPREVGLYRMAMTLPGLEAAADGLKVNHSAGAGVFKRNRGATPRLERMAVFDAHLPRARRATYAALASGLQALTPTLMRYAA